jgi:hypothetical protein
MRKGEKPDMKFHRVNLPAVLLVMIFCAAAWAQDTASITGTVSDPSGAAVAGAQVSIANAEHGIKQDGTSNGSGDFLFGSLPIGAYDLTVTASGFKKYEAKGVILRVADKARVNVALQVGAATTEVVVQGSEVAQVETQTSELAGTVTGKEISQLELNGRNFTQLVTLVPGVSNQTGQDEGGEGLSGTVTYSMNGGRVEYNNWEVDGGDNMDNGSNSTLNVFVSLDAIAEFKVLTSNYGAQYGRNGSGTVEVETKSGTKSFHGDAYEFVRNNDFNAKNIVQSETPDYKKNDWGYTIGGPVTIPGLYNRGRDKTFFFWSEEWRRDIQPGSSFTQPVPSAAERMGDFSDLCPNLNSGSAQPDYSDCPVVPGFTNGLGYTPNLTVVPGFNAGDPNVQALLGMIPLPTTGVPGAEIFQASPAQATAWREELLRVDHNFNDKVRAMFRFAHDSWSTTNAFPLWTNGGSFPTVQTAEKEPAVSMVARLTVAATPTLLNEFVFSYDTDHITLNNVGAFKRGSNITIGALFQNGFNGSLPGISLTDAGTAYGGGFAEDPGYIPNGPYNSNPTYTARDNVTKILGKHNLTIGAYFVAAEKNELGFELGGGAVPGLLGFNSSNGAVSSGNAFADLLLGNISSFGQQSSNPKYYNRYKIIEPYFQDDFHVTNRLTLNLGLRISMFGLYHEIKHQAYNFNPLAYATGATAINMDGSVSGNLYNGMVQCGVGGVPAGCMSGHLFNPAPRIGFAWDPNGDGKTAIRGGYGVFFEHTNGNEANTEVLEGSPPLATVPTQNNICPNSQGQCFGYTSIGSSAGGGAAPNFPLSVFSIPNKATWPYMQQWHLDIQRDIAKNTVVTVAYVGSKGTHLTRESDLNQLHSVPLSQNPYLPGEAIGPNDCGTSFDIWGVPTAATTPSGAPVTYIAPTTPGGLPSGPAVNLGVAACGTIADPFRPYPGYGRIASLQEAASSNYNALQVSARRNVGSLNLNMSYTYSHSIDDSSDRSDGSYVDSYSLNNARASSNFDQRHLFSFGYVWDIPFLKQPGLAHTLLGGWEYSGIASISSGTPFSVTNPVDNAGVGNGVATAASYPDLVGDPKTGIVQSPIQGFGPAFYNANAFATPRGLTFGDAGRNILRNPRRTNFDMALFKHFPIHESVAFEFRAEAYNVFNHTEYANLAGDGGQASSPNNTNSFGSTGFLYIGGAHNARILQLGGKIIF